MVLVHIVLYGEDVVGLLQDTGSVPRNGVDKIAEVITGVYIVHFFNPPQLPTFCPRTYIDAAGGAESNPGQGGCKGNFVSEYPSIPPTTILF